MEALEIKPPSTKDQKSWTSNIDYLHKIIFD